MIGGRGRGGLGSAKLIFRTSLNPPFHPESRTPKLSEPGAVEQGERTEAGRRGSSGAQSPGGLPSCGLCGKPGRPLTSVLLFLLLRCSPPEASLSFSAGIRRVRGRPPWNPIFTTLPQCPAGGVSGAYERLPKASQGLPRPPSLAALRSLPTTSHTGTSAPPKYPEPQEFQEPLSTPGP